MRDMNHFDFSFGAGAKKWKKMIKTETLHLAQKLLLAKKQNSCKKQKDLNYLFRNGFAAH